MLICVFSMRVKLIHWELKTKNPLRHTFYFFSLSFNVVIRGVECEPHHFVVRRLVKQNIYFTIVVIFKYENWIFLTSLKRQDSNTAHLRKKMARTRKRAKCGSDDEMMWLGLHPSTWLLQKSCKSHWFSTRNCCTYTT